jgi:hypothetical protein
MIFKQYIPGKPLPENFGVNKLWVGFKTGYLLSGISKTLRSAINPAGYSPNFLMVGVIFYLCLYATSQKKNLDRNIAPRGVLDRCFLCAYFIEQFPYSRMGQDAPYYQRPV